MFGRDGYLASLFFPKAHYEQQAKWEIEYQERTIGGKVVEALAPDKPEIREIKIAPALTEGQEKYLARLKEEAEEARRWYDHAQIMKLY